MRRWLSIFVIFALMPLGVPLQAVTYTIAPQSYQTVFDNSGAIVSGACVWTYTAGSSTPATTYSDSSGTTNSNPIQADSAGRFVAYLAPGSSYKFVYEAACTPPAHGTTLKTVDNISAMGLGSVQANDIGNCEGRITLTSGTPVTVSDVTAAATVFFTPYAGSQCSLYDPVAGSWSVTTFSEVSLALGTDTTGKNYDLWAYSNSGVFTLERLVWTNDTTRATALTTQDGVLVKAGQTSRRYLGTYRTTGAGTTEDSSTKRFVWNYYNRVPRFLRKIDATATWSYFTAAYRQARAQAANQVEAVIGVAEVTIDLTLESTAANTTGDGQTAVSIGEDSTTTPATGIINTVMFSSAAAAGAQVPMVCRLLKMPAVGYHFYAWLEFSNDSTGTTWIGTHGTPVTTSGLTGVIDG